MAKSAQTKNFLAENSLDLCFDTIPPYSLDMNIIENSWAYSASQNTGLLSPIFRHRDAGLLSASRGAGTGGPNLISLRTQWLQLVVEPALVGVV